MLVLPQARRVSLWRPLADRPLNRRQVRSRGVLTVFASLVSLGFLAATIVPPQGFASAAVAEDAALATGAQGFSADDDFSNSARRDGFKVTQLRILPPAVGTPDPGTAQAIALEMVTARGWDKGEFSCLVALWNRESHWNVYAHNARTDAYGIPQAMPGSKMASAGADWKTNARTQIAWGLGYIANRYGTPCKAWSHSEATGWY